MLDFQILWLVKKQKLLSMSLSEYWKVLKDAKEARDIQMINHLQNKGFVEMLDTIIKDSTFVINHPEITRREDGVYIYKGKEELEKYINWLFSTVSDMKFIDDGIGIIVQENKGIFQHIFECTFRGSRIKVPTFCTYLFNGYKCKIHKTIKAANSLPHTNKII